MQICNYNRTRLWLVSAAVIVAGVCSCLTFAQSVPNGGNLNEEKGVVKGTIIFTQGTDGSVIPRQPRQLPEPMSGVRVVMLEYFGKEEKAGKIIASATTNEMGDFSISVKPGMYFCALQGELRAGGGSITTGFGGKNFELEQEISEFRVINVIAQEPNIVVFDVHGQVPQ